MRTLIKTALLSLLLTGAAGVTHAADLIIEPPVMTTPTPVSNWDRFYVGGFIGYGAGFADQNGPNPPAGPYPAGGVDISLSGVLVGMTAGKNFAMGNGIVLGLAGDVAWSNMGGTYTSATFPGSLYSGTTQRINWTADLRGRVGYDAGAFLPYLTGGLAAANATRVSGFSGSSANTTQLGYTVGAGVELAVNENASIDLQYRYSNYGTGTYTWTPATGAQNPTLALTTHAITVGLNWAF